MSKFLGFLLGIVVAAAGPAAFGILTADGGIELTAREMALAYGIGALVFWAVVSYFSGAAALGAALMFGLMVYAVHWIPNRTTNLLNDVPGVTTGMIDGLRTYVLNGVVPILAVISLVYAIQSMVRAVRTRRRERAEAERLQREQELAQAQEEAEAQAAYQPVRDDYATTGQNRFSHFGNSNYDDLFDDEPVPAQPRNQADEHTRQFAAAAPATSEHTMTFDAQGNDYREADPRDGDNEPTAAYRQDDDRRGDAHQQHDDLRPQDDAYQLGDERAPEYRDDRNDDGLLDEDSDRQRTDNRHDDRQNVVRQQPDDQQDNRQQDASVQLDDVHQSGDDYDARLRDGYQQDDDRHDDGDRQDVARQQPGGRQQDIPVRQDDVHQSGDDHDARHRDGDGEDVARRQMDEREQDETRQYDEYQPDDRREAGSHRRDDVLEGGYREDDRTVEQQAPQRSDGFVASPPQSAYSESMEQTTVQSPDADEAPRSHRDDDEPPAAGGGQGIGGQAEGGRGGAAEAPRGSQAQPGTASAMTAPSEVGVAGSRTTAAGNTAEGEGGRHRFAQPDEEVGQQYRERMDGPDPEDTGEFHLGAFGSPSADERPGARLPDFPAHFRPAGA